MKAIFVGYVIVEKSYRVYSLRLNIVMESIHVVFYDKKIQGLTDEGHQESLHFEKEFFGDSNETEYDDCSHNAQPVKNQIAIDINQPTNILSVDQHESANNVSTNNPSTYIQNSWNRSTNLGGVSHSYAINPQESNQEEDAPSSSISNLPPKRKWIKTHPFELIIGDANEGVRTISVT